MKKIALFLLLTTEAFSVCLSPPSPQPASGFGCDVPTAVVCTPSGSDSSKATCTWNTVLASDSLVSLIDGGNNPGPTTYNATMCVPSGGVCPHSVTIGNITVPATGHTTIKYMVSSCTHATSGGIGTQCPDASQDWSSTGPPTRMPGSPPTFATNPRPTGLLSSWWTVAQAPQNVFPGQEFYIGQKASAGNGQFSSVVAANNINFLLFYNVSITSTTAYGNQTCGFANPNGATYQAYGDTTFSVPCLGGSSAADFILEPVPSTTWIQPNVNGNATPGVVSVSSGTMLNAGQAGYFINTWLGQDFGIYVKVGASVPAGNYVLHYHLQPLLSNGCGNSSFSGALCSGGDTTLVSQDKQVDVPITVIALAPLANHPPVSFPPWSFQPQFMAQAEYWTTWACSNYTEAIRTGNQGSMAKMYISGVYENWNTSDATSSFMPWVYDGASNYLGTGDLIYANTYPAWIANHNYTIGDHITMTVSGKPTTFVMNLVNGASSPGLIGTSGNSTPSFTRDPGSTTIDALLQWMSVVDKDYYQGCALKAMDGFRNTFLMNQTTNAQEYTYQPGGMVMSAFRTGDASPGDETGFTYTAATGSKFSKLTPIGNGFTEPAACNGLTETGTGTYFTGGSKLALCYLSSPLSQLGTAVNGNNLFNGRQKGFGLNVMSAYWSLTNDPTWINGNNPGDDGGARTKRQVETLLAFLDMYMTIPSSQVVEASSSSLGSIGAYFMSGIAAEALINYYIDTVYFSNRTLFPCTGNGGTTYTTGYMGPCVNPDERIPQAVKTYADRTWVNEFDIEFDKNQVVTDGCYPAHTPQCQTSRRLHSYTTRYNRWTFPDYSYAGTFDTESDSNGEYGFVWAWLWARDSTMVPPSNGRFVVTSYRDIAQIMWQHSYDGRNCSPVSGTTPGNCFSWGVQDFVNGGRSTGSAGYNNLVNSSKTVQQTIYNTMREGLNWANGIWPSTQGVFQLASNPCWIVANRNADGSCNTPSPFTDVMAPYPLSFYFNGPYPPLGTSNRPGASPITICRPGIVGNQNTSICVQPNPTQTPTASGFGSNNVAINGTGVGSNKSTISNTFVIFNFMTTKNATCSMTVGPTSGGTTEPAHTGGNTFAESPASVLVTGVPVPLWFHTIQATGLTPTTAYHFGIYCTDDGSNPPDPATCTANADHCFNYPYDVTTAPPKSAISFGGQNQAQTFTTTALPTGADLIISPGVIVQPGTKSQ